MEVMVLATDSAQKIETRTIHGHRDSTPSLSSFAENAMTVDGSSRDTKINFRLTIVMLLDPG